MPSKGKKNQKYSSSPSPSQSPRTPSTPLSASSTGEDTLHHRHLLSSLSSAHPSLLPSASSVFSGTIVDSEASLSKGNRAVVYLSETAVVSSAFHPGSLVSVSLVPSDTQLDDSDVCTADADAGRQFSIATVFPSRYKRWSEAVLGPFLYNGFPYYWPGHIYISSLHNFAHRQVFIDELDAIAPARGDGTENLSLRMVASLLKLMDEIGQTDRVIVIAATNRPDSIDPALRRPGRLDREIEIGVPSPDQRLGILTAILRYMDHSLSQAELHLLASETHGFVGADLAALCNEAALNSLRQHIKLKGEKPSDFIGSLSNSLSKLTVSSEDVMGMNGDEDLIVRFEDFEKAKLKVRPSAMREVMLELPKVRWEDVGGQSKIKEQPIEAVQWPQLCPEAFDRIGISPPRGLLMIGPPGCSKTLMARAVASEAKLNFLAVKGPELFSKWVGDSEKAVKALFAKARANKPAIIFFDEIDGLAVTRGGENDGVSVADRVLSQLLVEMDGLDLRTGVTVIAATNRPDKIDPALLRPGRFDRLLDVQPPDEADREEIFQVHTKKMPCAPDVRLRELAVLTEGYTGADIKLVCREAAISALEESFDINEVSMRHFKKAVSNVQPSDLKFYQNLGIQFRRLVDAT